LSKVLEIRATELARNTALNFVGQVVPILVGVATIPYLVRGLGADRFGVLSLAWVVLGYISLFDLGLGRATTKFVAECLGGQDQERLPSLVWTSVGLQLLFGMIGTVLVGAATPLLVDKLLKIPPALMGETKRTFFILAASLPIVLATNGFRGVLEAGQHFDLVNYVKLPANVSVFLLPAVALPFGLKLPGIVLLLVLARVGALLAYLTFCLKRFPALAGKFPLERKLLGVLISYGGWVTVSNIVNPLLVYGDRFFVGALLSTAALTYYSVPFEVVTRIWIVAQGLAAALFPAFSTLEATGSRDKLESLYARSFKYLLIVLGPVVLFAVAFAGDILNIWLGPDFAARSTFLMQVLAVGVLLNSLTHLPYSLLQALDRPDTVAGLFVLELPCYAALLWFSISRFGLPGAAVAWSVRVGIEAILFLIVARELLALSPGVWADGGILKSLFAVAVLFGTALPASTLSGWPLPARFAAATACAGIFAWVAWRYLLDDTDRRPVRTIIRALVAPAKRAN